MIREGMKVGLLPGTFDIKRSYMTKEYSRYEVTKSPGVSFNEIGGLKEVKQELIKSIILPMVNPDDYSRYGECSRRILMYGPPGCGKTMCAKALASALPNCEFVKVGAGELFSMWLGESEKNVRMVFKAANDKLEEGENDYGVIFFDEIDALAQERGMYTGSSGAPERVTGQLLDILDGFYALHPHLTVIGATNRLHLIDSAFRSRFDKIIEVPKPDREAAYSIASIYSKKIPIDYYLIKDKAGGYDNRAVHRTGVWLCTG
jgi:transitional endoplasmic reticulum ATPase